MAHRTYNHSLILSLIFTLVSPSAFPSTEMLSLESQELALFRCMQATYQVPAQVREYLDDTNVFTVSAIHPETEKAKFQIATSLNGYEGVIQLSSSDLVFINKYKKNKNLRGDEEVVGTFRLIAEDRAERILKFMESVKTPGLHEQIRASFAQCSITAIGATKEDAPFLQRLTSKDLGHTTTR